MNQFNTLKSFSKISIIPIKYVKYYIHIFIVNYYMLYIILIMFRIQIKLVKFMY